MLRLLDICGRLLAEEEQIPTKLVEYDSYVENQPERNAEVIRAILAAMPRDQLIVVCKELGTTVEEFDVTTGKGRDL